MGLSPGDKFRSYEVVAPIGAGGMGEVYRARDTRLKREVALLATLNHPNIAAIYGFETSGGIDALVLELVEGPTLAERIERRTLLMSEAIAIAQQIADAVDAAHERGVVHRDLKPSVIAAESQPRTIASQGSAGQRRSQQRLAAIMAAASVVGLEVIAFAANGRRRT